MTDWRIMEAITDRLATLEQEFSRGERKLRELQAYEQELRETLLRLSGAIGALREYVDAGEEAPGTMGDAALHAHELA
jgi:hypothetical protein